MILYHEPDAYLSHSDVNVTNLTLIYLPLNYEAKPNLLNPLLEKTELCGRILPLWRGGRVVECGGLENR